MSAPPTLHGCTISTPGYLAHARVLAESFLAHNRGLELLGAHDRRVARGQEAG